MKFNSYVTPVVPKPLLISFIIIFFFVTFFSHQQRRVNSTEDLEDGRLDEGLNRLTFNRSSLSGDLSNNFKNKM